jgi:PAS domain S-box-containing protein
MIGVTLDVTERKRADMALAENSERLRLALQASRMGDWSWEAASDALNLSPRAADIFGVGPDFGLTWGSLRDLLHPADLDRVAAAVDAALASGDQYSAEYRVVRPSDRKEIWVEANGQTTRGHDGQVSGLIGVVQDVSERKYVEERQTLLIRELHHRVKNTLATVQAIVGSTARSAVTIDEFYQGFVGRIVSLAKTHNLLTEDYWQTAALNEMLANELGPYDDDGGTRVALDGPRVELTSEIAVPIGMAIHELTTNAIKYGALLAPAGRVVVSWTVSEVDGRRMLRFVWREEGGPPVSEPRRQGFGSRLLQRVLATQLQAKVQVDFAPSGLVFTMDAPLPDRPSGPDLSMPAERKDR